MFVSTKDLNHATLFYGRLVGALKNVVYEGLQMAAADAGKHAAWVKPAWINDRIVKI